MTVEVENAVTQISLPNFSRKLVNACTGHYNVYTEEVPVLLHLIINDHHIYNKKKKKNLHISSFVKPTESNNAFEKMADLSINQLSYNIRTTELTGVITVL